MDTSLLQQGVGLMLYGMGTVVIFLTVLVMSMTLMSWLVGRFVKPASGGAASRVMPEKAGRTPARDTDERLVAVITAAVHRYRSRRGS